MKLFSVLLLVVIPALNARPAYGTSHLDSTRDATPIQNSEAPANLAGTWVFQTRDSSTSQNIKLVLRRDGSYTKTLDATVNGARYGGTHSGTWTARGMIVRLSGDGNWPAYTHDLSEFRKVE